MPRSKKTTVPAQPELPFRQQPKKTTMGDFDPDILPWALEQARAEGISVQRWMRNRIRDLKNGARRPPWRTAKLRDVPQGAQIWVRCVPGEERAGTRAVHVDGVGGTGAWHIPNTADVYIREDQL